VNVNAEKPKSKPLDPIIFKLNALDRSIQRVALEVGLGSHHVTILGDEWKMLCKAWLQAETALVKTGGVALSLETREVPVPSSIKVWGNSRKSKDMQDVNFGNIGKEMLGWWKGIGVGKADLDADELIAKDWCGGGLLGILLLMVGMKEWGLALKGEEEKMSWTEVVMETTQVFKMIPSAKAL